MKIGANRDEFNFETVFNPEDCLHFYGDMLHDERTAEEVKFLVRELKLAPAMRILDLGCGYGRHALQLAKMGCKVLGIDSTHGFLEIARARAREEDLAVDLVLGDMREIAFNEEFDSGILMFSTFGYFEDEENIKILSRLGRALKKGGMACIDIVNRKANCTGMKETLLRAELELSGIFGAWDSSPLTPDSFRMILTARKQD